MNSGQAFQAYFGGVGAGALLEQPQWYAIHTRSRHEKMVAEQLERQSIESFLPVEKRTHKWSDRTREVELPLFSGYSFVRVVLCSPDRLRVLQTHGAARGVGIRRLGIRSCRSELLCLKT